MKKGATVVYESTVYPGATEDVCIPILEKHSGMKWMRDFHVGYSPERVNPGDKEHTITRIEKVVSGDDAATLEKVAQLYGSVITAGIHKATSIKVAEAAKVIENTQRDLNIALMNELALIFHKMGIDTLEVLQAAGTKWNFLPFRPGWWGAIASAWIRTISPIRPTCWVITPRLSWLVGVSMTAWLLMLRSRPSNRLSQRGAGEGAKVIVLGLTFKENCPDLRNSKVVDVVRELQTFGCDAPVHDPLGEPREAQHEYGISLTQWDDLPLCDAVVAAVAHRTYLDKPFGELTARLKKGGVFTDVKCAHDPATVLAAGFKLWRL